MLSLLPYVLTQANISANILITRQKMFAQADKRAVLNLLLSFRQNKNQALLTGYTGYLLRVKAKERLSWLALKRMEGSNANIQTDITL